LAKITINVQSVYKIFQKSGQMVYYKDRAKISKLLIFNKLSSLARGGIFGILLDYSIPTLHRDGFLTRFVMVSAGRSLTY
jgi:hypothetical protein